MQKVHNTLVHVYISVIHVLILDCVYIHVGVVTINTLCYTNKKKKMFKYIIILKPANTNILLNIIVLLVP